MGHRSRQAGNAFEERIGNALTAAQQQRLVLWFAHQEPHKTMAGKPIAQSGADWIGVLRGGAMLAIECKSATERSNTMRIGRNDFSPEQQTHLTATARAGGFSAAALEFRDEKTGVYRAFLVPWFEVPWSLAKTNEHVYLEDIHEQWLLKPDNVIASMLDECPTCRTLMPARSNGHRSCCWPLPAL